MRIMAARAGNLSFQDGVPRIAMNLRLLSLMALSADFRLRERIQHLLIRIVCLVTISARHTVHLVLTPRPVGSGQHLRFMTTQASRISLFNGRKVFRFGAEHDVWRLAAWIAHVIGAGTVTGLTTGSASIRLHAVLSLIDGEDWRSPILIVADRALLIAFERPVRLRERARRAKKCRKTGAH